MVITTQRFSLQIISFKGRPCSRQSLLDCESVSEAAYCYEVSRIGWVVFDLLSKSVDVHHDGVFVDDSLAPDDAVDHILGEDVVYVVDEELYHRVLLG